MYPYYPQIAQISLDLQAVSGPWLWKGEALFRTGQGSDFWATTFGLEYTRYGILGSATDLGFLLEYVDDDRDATIKTMFDHDIMFGLRWSANDAAYSLREDSYMQLEILAYF